MSFEVFADTPNVMNTQGEKISKWGKNVYVKVPVVNSQGVFMGNVIKHLNLSNIKLNITAVYTTKQVSKTLSSNITCWSNISKD